MPSASNTSGVIHPPQSLLRGKVLRSISRVSSPDSRSPQAQEDPAGPPPTIKTSQESIIRRLPYLGPGWRRCTGGCASMERTYTGPQQTRSGTTGACRPERQRWIRQDRAATCARNSSLDHGRRCHKRSQICLTSVLWSRSEQLERADPKGSDGSGKIEPPHAREIRPSITDDGVISALKSA